MKDKNKFPFKSFEAVFEEYNKRKAGRFFALIFPQQEKDDAVLEILQKYGKSNDLFCRDMCGHFETKTMPAALD